MRRTHTHTHTSKSAAAPNGTFLTLMPSAQQQVNMASTPRDRRAGRYDVMKGEMGFDGSNTGQKSVQRTRTRFFGGFFWAKYALRNKDIDSGQLGSLWSSTNKCK